MGKSKEWKWGYITPNGQIAILPTFDGASDFCEGLAAVKVDWARGYIDHKGNFVIKPIFEAAEDFKDGLAIVKLDGETQFIDTSGNIQNNKSVPSTTSTEIETDYDPQYKLHDGLVRFVENQKYGYKDKEGKVIIKPIYFEATDFSEGLACVKKGKTGSWSYIDTSGETIIPASFKQAKPFHEGLAAVLIGLDDNPE